MQMLLKARVRKRMTDVLGSRLLRGHEVSITLEQYNRYPGEFELIEKPIEKPEVKEITKKKKDEEM